MRVNMVGAFIRNAPFGTEIAFAKGMRRLGHEINEIDTSYPDQTFWKDADATLVFKWMDRSEYWEQLEECRGVKVVYQPDDARFPHIRQMLLDMRHYVDHVLTFDQYGVDLAQQMGYRSAEFMLLTADDDLYCPDRSAERDIDVSFVGSLTRGANHVSRMRMCEITQNLADHKGWRVWLGETYFGESGTSPVDIYRRSKVVLNHATDVGQPFGYGYGLQCRHFEVGMTETALLTNSVYGGISPWPCPIFVDEQTLVSQLEIMLAGSYKIHARNLYNHVKEMHLPQHRAQQLVDFIVRNS